MHSTGEPLADGSLAAVGPARLVGKLRSALRARGLIVAELLLVALAGLLVTVIPQRGEPGAERFALEHPVARTVLSALGLDSLLYSPGFLALVALTALTLVLVLWDQWRRALRLLGATPAAASFARAPYRVELVLPESPGAPSTVFETHGRLGSWGTPIFHLGLLLLIVAGLVRAAFGRDAVVDAIEGEALPVEPGGFAAEWGGPLSTPFSLPEPVRVEALRASFYPSGGLLGIESRLAVGPEGATRTKALAVNAPLDLGPQRLFVSMIHGPVALLELQDTVATERLALLLKGGLRTGSYEAIRLTAGGLEVRLRGQVAGDGALPEQLQLRVVREGALLYAGALSTGEAIELPQVGRLGLSDVRLWARFRGSRDHALPLAYLGFLLIVGGASLMFSVVQIDTMVQRSPDSAGTKLVIAMRPHRFAPLFAERFEALVARHRAGQA